MIETKVKLESKIFTDLRRALSSVPMEMAGETGEEFVKSTRQPKKGVQHRGFKRRSSAKGETPAEQTGQLNRSKKVKRTGEFSAHLTFDAPHAGNLLGKDRKIPATDVPTLEKRQKVKSEKVVKELL